NPNNPAPIPTRRSSYLVAGVGDDFARGGVDRLQWRAGPRCRQRRALRPPHDVEDLVHLLARLAEDERARDVGLITLHRAAVVDRSEEHTLNYSHQIISF